MTEMNGVGVTLCRECHYCYEMYHMICYCYNANSDHYGHVIMDFHPICEEFTQKEER